MLFLFLRSQLQLYFLCCFFCFLSFPFLCALLFFVFTARRYALRSLSYRNSVCPSVTLQWTVSTWFDQRLWFLHHMVAPYDSSFWRYHVHPKIRRGSPRARALNEGGVGTNWRFSTFKPPYVRCKIRHRLMITNRKSNTRFQLVPKSTSLVDPEMTLDGNYALCCITHMLFGANH